MRSNLDSRVSKSGTGSASGASASYLWGAGRTWWGCGWTAGGAGCRGRRAARAGRTSRAGAASGSCGGRAPGAPGGVGAGQRVGQVAERVQLRQRHDVEPHRICGGWRGDGGAPGGWERCRGNAAEGLGQRHAACVRFRSAQPASATTARPLAPAPAAHPPGTQSLGFLRTAAMSSALPPRRKASTCSARIWPDDTCGDARGCVCGGQQGAQAAVAQAPVPRCWPRRQPRPACTPRTRPAGRTQPGLARPLQPAPPSPGSCWPA